MNALPLWLPDLLGMVSGLLLTVPAWRASGMLRAVATIRREAAQVPRVEDPGYESHAEVVEGLTKAMLGSAQVWNRADDLLLKAGILLLIASFAVKLLS